MTRGHGWRFLDMGRKIERALHTDRPAALDADSAANAGRPIPGYRKAPLLEALLEIADSSMTYRRRYLSGVQAAAVLDLLIADESNPRSLVYQLQSLREVIEQLPHDPQQAVRAPEQRMIVLAVDDGAVGGHSGTGPSWTRMAIGRGWSNSWRTCTRICRCWPTRSAIII